MQKAPSSEEYERDNAMASRNYEPPRYQPNEKLRAARLRRGWTQTELAAQIQLNDYHTVSRWERGTSFPNPLYRLRLCRVFGMTAEQLGLEKEKGSKDPPATLISACI